MVGARAILSPSARFCTSAIRPSLLHLLERARPIRLQQSRQRAVREQTAVGLAAGAVIGLVVGVDDALHRRAADRTRLAEAAMHGHLRTERGDLLRKAI